MQQVRFTNVYRELDPGTQYAIQQILEVDAPKPDKIFNVMLYRLIGRAKTHAEIGFQRLQEFDPSHLERTLKAIRDDRAESPFTAAYMVSAYVKMGSHEKIENVVRLFAQLHSEFASFYARIEPCVRPDEVYDVLRSAYGFGNFLAYQVLVDLLYPLQAYGGRPLLPFSHDDWASAGPGARRGVAMLVKEDLRVSHLDVMRWLRWHQRSEFSRLGLEFPYLVDRQGTQVEISLANIQNCLCEFHKYVKISEGWGRGRRKFAPSTSSAPTQLSFNLNSVEQSG
jgi:hypothetical protein